jgi:hypothetical protein
MDLVSLPPSTAPPAAVHRHGTGGCSLLPGAEPSPLTHAVCSLESFGDRLRHLPAHIEHFVLHYVWPHVPAAGLTLLTLVVAWRAARALSLRRAAAGSWHARVIPPRAVDPAQAGQVWDLLAALVRCAARWRIAAPPVAFEVWARDGELTARLWLPARITQPAVADVAAQAWPGARVEADAPPGLVSEGRAVVAAWRLSSSVSESRWLVRSDLATAAMSRRDAGAGRETAEPLRSVLSGLVSAPVPALLQVLVRPVPRRRRAALRHAASHGGRPTAPLVIRLLRSALNLLQRAPASPPAGTGRAADPFAAQAVREAADKIAARPELLAAIRVGAAGPRRAIAASAARQIADGYVLASRILHPARIRRAADMLSQRRARRGDWLLVSAAELGVLAHLPADPARYQFTTAALHRPHPHSAYLAEPEQATPGGSGWTGHAWTSPPDGFATHDPDPEGDDDHGQD